MEHKNVSIITFVHMISHDSYYILNVEERSGKGTIARVKRGTKEEVGIFCKTKKDGPRSVASCTRGEIRRVHLRADSYDFFVVVSSAFRSATIIDQHAADLLLLLACLVPHSAAGFLHGETHFPPLTTVDQFRAASSTWVPFVQL